MGAQYESLGTIRRGPTNLAIQHRSDQTPPYTCVTWRAAREESGTNRRFYNEQGAYWSLSARLALEMLSEAEDSGFLSSEHHRWPGITPETHIGPSAGSGVLVDSDADERWRSSPNLEAIWCLEPNHLWRKAMLVLPDADLVTFRSLTSDSEYPFIENATSQDGWKLDRAMQDTDGTILARFLELLKSCLSQRV